ncbi:MAG: radical SAM protein [Myxococcaceae bacterium]|nr:radical SAM protein [Myxococcaceae bacterium]
MEAPRQVTIDARPQVSAVEEGKVMTDAPDTTRPTQRDFGFIRPRDCDIGASAGVAFVEMPARSIINRVQGTRLSHFFSINPYRGCEHACAYCYARYTHEFLDQRASEDFERRVYVKVNAPEIFAQDLRRRRGVGQQQLLFGSATDPYQPVEARFELTRRMLEKLLPLKGLSVGIVTKSPLIERDIDLIGELARRHDLELLISCAFVGVEAQRALEPRVAAPARRLQTIERFAAAGIEVGLLLAPILPGINGGESELTELCRRARRAGASRVFGQTLFLGGATRGPFFEWLARHRPHLLDNYRRGYREGLELCAEWKEAFESRLWRARRAAGFDEGPLRRHRSGAGCEERPREFMSFDEAESALEAATPSPGPGASLDKKTQ